MKKSFFAIVLIAIIFGSCKKDKKETPITITPVANFTFNVDSNSVPCIVTFTNTSTNATSYVWDFGDSTAIDTTKNPSHAFIISGNFTVKLTATSSSGSNSIQKIVNILIKYNISSSDVGAAGTNYIMAIDTTNLTGFSLDIAGEGKVWDFALVSEDKKDTMKFLAPASTPAASSFPTSNLVMMPIPGQEVYAYLNKTDAVMETMGLYAIVQGITASASYTDKQTIMKFPLYFGTSFNDLGSVDLIANGGTFWVKVEMRTNYSCQIDASGKVTTPTGTFDCIRDKRTEIQNQKIYIGFTQTGPWTQQDETNDTTYTYAFYSKGKGYSVAEVKVVNFTSNTINQIKYLK